MSDGRQKVYAVLDCARAPMLYGLVGEIDPLDAPCLFEGKLDEDVRRVSPHVVALAAAPKLTDIWGRQGLGRAWGVFLTSTQGLDVVRRHLRRFTQVRLPDGRGPVLFRFWDPRVLHPFLAAAPAEHLDRMFGPVTSWVVETPAGLERQVNAAGTLHRLPAAWGALGG